MTPERWRQVTEIFHAAADRTPAARNAFLDGACGQDASLRAHVDSLLDAHERAGTADGIPLLTGLLPHFEPGTRLGPYRVEEIVGAGGMGEVYRATDTRLHRSVAIKVLQPGLIGDSDFRRRFEREAQVLAALNHPNIAAIHGLEDLAGTPALVLEFVEGPTLEAMIGRVTPGIARSRRVDGTNASQGGQAAGAGRRGLKMDDALTIARQIALALEAAHARGIFHRDLKPANIKIAPDGIVKVLDFGIAKADEVASSAPLATAPRRTGTGVVLGTAAYMSPEQARGGPVDKRTDIWAFGCVLFEMLTGRRAFEAATFSDAIARILEREPDWSLLPPDVPDSIRRLLRRCLTKDPVDRLHDIADARLDIADASSPQTTTVPMVAGGSGRKPWLWTAVALIPAAAIAVWSVLPRPDTSPASPRPVEFGISFPENLVPAHGVAVSPDGRYVAAGIYGAAGQVWLHSIETSDTRPVAGAERSSTPFWSPDSSHLAFFAGGALRKKNMATGLVSRICEVTSVPYGGAWNSEGRIVFGAGGTLFQVSAAGGDASPLVLENQPQYAGFPQFLPGGRQFLFHSWGPGGGWVQVGSLASRATKRLVDSSVAGVFGAPDRLLFVRGTTLLAQRLDLARLELVGEAEAVASGAGAGMLNLGSNLGALSASTNGVLAYAAERGGRPGRLTWFDRSGAAQASLQTVEDVEFLNPAISPIGELVAVNRMEPQTGNWDIWIVDVQRSVPTRLTFDPAVDADPVWSPDGREIVYTSDRGGRLGMYRQAIGSPDPPELLFAVEGANTLIARDWTADGKYILFYEAGAKPWSVWALPLSGERKPILVHERAYGGHVSPDGAWVAYNALSSGGFEVFVQRFPNAGAKQQISQGGGVHARWISGGRELVYWTVPGGLSRVSLNASPSGLRVGTPRTIVQAPVLSLIDGRTHFDVTPDGQRFLVRQPAGPPGPGLKVIVNWTARLRQ